MASRADSAPAKKNRRRPIVRPREPAKPRRSARLRANDSREPPFPQPRPAQASSTRPAPISHPTHTRRKRPRDSEAEVDDPKSVHPAKQPRRLPSPRLKLSETNLRKLNGEEMDVAANNAPALRIKRSSSQRSITASSDVTQDSVRSQRSSGTTAYYRYTHLAAAAVYIHTDPPDDIQDVFNVIVKAEPSRERRAELKAISQELHDGFTKAVKAALGEDDCIELFLIALRALNHRSLCLRAKADWREELKPTIQQSGLNLNFMAVDQQQEVDDTSASPRKRQQQSAGQTYISPRTSMTDVSNPSPANKPLGSGTMPPPAPPEKEGDRSPIKTPRPDISMGIQHATLISALSSQNLNNTRARLFLAELQNKLVRRESGVPEEPMLISVPALRASDLVFPFAVIEGKAYSTGKQVFEAENQAAISGACGLKIQLCLDELAKGATTGSDVLPTPLKDKPPLFFSVCTQGPFHELWVHYTNIEDGVRKFNMVLLKTCHGTLLESVENFIVAVDNVCRWGTGKFVESVVERLGKVARMAGAGA